MLSVPCRTIRRMGEVFLGGEALAAGRVTRHQLQRWYRTVYRGVYVPKGGEVSLRDRAVGAWLASGRRGVIAGVAASALHHASWVDNTHPIELVGVKCRPQPGLIPRLERTADDEVTTAFGLPVTTRLRTAFDLGRHLNRPEALARLDALMWTQRSPSTTWSNWPADTPGREASASYGNCSRWSTGELTLPGRVESGCG